MAIHKSAIRQHRRDEKKRLINKMKKTKMRTKIKQLRKIVSSGNIEEAKKVYPEVVSTIDQTVVKGAIQKKTGSRYKSRLSLLVNKASVKK